MLGRGWALLAAGTGLLVLAIVVAVNVTGAAPRELSSNLVRPLAFDIVLDRGQEACQPVEYVPVGTAGLELRVGTFGEPGPPLRATVSAPGAAPATGRLAGGWRQGDVVVPVETLRRAREGGSVCIRNRGRAPIALAGHSIGLGPPARVDGREAGSHVRVAYVRSGDGSWLSRIGFVADRVAATRAAVPGAATFWLWMACALGVILGAVALTLRGART